MGEADQNHPLAPFSGNPEGSVMDGEDAWEKFDGPLNTLLQRPLRSSATWFGLARKVSLGSVVCWNTLSYTIDLADIQGMARVTRRFGKLDQLISVIDKV